jgi:predicted transcriptional regulator
MPELVDIDTSESARLFTELAGELRRLILLKLNERNTKLAELARELDTTIQHVHANVERLTKAGFVEKDHKGSLTLTPYGKIVMSQLPTLEFLVQHKDYFMGHTLGDIPLKFQRRVGDLSSCTVVKGVVAVLQRWKLMYQGAGLNINTITSQVLVDFIEPLANKIRSGTKLCYILPEDAVIPKGTLEVTKKVSWDSLLAEKKAERKMVKKLLVSVIVTDKAACVSFPDLKDEVDMNMVLYSEDPIFMEWCEDYFKYMWENADLFDKRKLRYEA